ncbi:resuscitation-promoting factor [Nocardioides yefusunii]|uniref:Transglycosylase family protein n=1 Tax=Nocardioides yefusunii TaxID=2500546 RepID=A0ABW1R0R5_9ACTN|nr:resuscitation-promoting factor [Nocardioides yefusunii]
MRSSIAQKTKAALHSRKLLAALGGVVAVAVVGTTVGYASLSKSVTLTLDGETQTLTALGGTVGEILASEGIEVGENDVVAPALGKDVQDGTAITVAFARPLDLTVDGKQATHWVTATSVGGALEQLGRRYDGADLSVSRSAALGREGMDIDVVTPKTVKVKVADKKAKKHEVTALTVAEVLAELDVKVSDADKVKPALDTEIEDGTAITVTRIKVTTDVVKGQKIAHDVVEKKTATLEKGETKVVEEGRDGSRDVTYEVRTKNGKVVSRTEVSSKVTQKPQTRVVKVGTKEPEVVEADEPAKAAPAAPTAPNYASGNTVWDQLAKCESGGNWSINTGNGYYGGLQFSPSSWRAVGGSGLPHQASREEQIKRGQMLQARGGWGQWPSCSSKLGLR